MENLERKDNLILVLNQVCSDGVGDFEHFRTIMKHLLQQNSFKDDQFYGLVVYDRRDRDEDNLPLENRLKNECAQLEDPFDHFQYSVHLNYSEELDTESIHHLFRKASQILLISYGLSFEKYHQFVRNDVIVKYIGEHEATTAFVSLEGLGHTLARSLGLTVGCFGLKISEPCRYSRDDCYDMIQKNDPEFSAKILGHFQCNSLKEFFEQYLCIPAYFNQRPAYRDFLSFILQNQSLFGQKKICFYQTGLKEKNIAPISVQDQEVPFYFIGPDSHQAVIPEGHVPILYGFRVADASYDAILRLAGLEGVVGCSGDNSLEKTISMEAIPWYQSTNSKEFKTIPEIRRMTQLSQISMSPEARQSFNLYFDPEVYQDYRNKKNNPLSQINLKEMVRYWPAVVSYLRKNYNFYHQLNQIVRERSGLLSKHRPRIQQNLLRYAEHARSLLSGWTNIRYSSVPSQQDSIEQTVTKKRW